MRKKYYTEIVGIILISFLGTLCIQSHSQALEVYADAIEFDFLEGYTNDALLISGNDGAAAYHPEYVNGFNNDPVAYIKNQSDRWISVAFAEENGYDGLAHLYIELTISAGVGIGTICGIFFPNYDFNDNGDFRTIKLKGNLPGTVGRHTFTWSWKIFAIPVNEPGYSAEWNTSSTQHTYFTLLGEPQEPMDVPWVNVLNFACVWASGESSANGTATKTTEALYNNSGFNYNGTAWYGSGNNFELADFVSEIGQGQLVNCLDVAKAVTTFANSVGCDLAVRKFVGTVFNYPEYGFWVNLIDPIGSSPITNNIFESPLVDNDCREGYFLFHAFSVNSSLHVWDACLKYDTDADPDNVVLAVPPNQCGVAVPINNDPLQLPCDIPDNTYLNNLIDDWVYEIGSCSEPFDCGYYVQLGAINIDN